MTERINVTIEMSGVAKAAADLNDAFYRLEGAWDAMVDPISAGEQTAVEMAIGGKNFPFPDSLEETSARVSEWARLVREVAKNPPGMLNGVAAQMRDDAAVVRGVLVKENDVTTDEAYSRWQTGGLSGEVGDFGAAMGPGVAENLADLLDGIAAGDLDGARTAAEEVARQYRAGCARR